MNAMLEPRIVAARTQEPLDVTRLAVVPTIHSLPGAGTRRLILSAETKPMDTSLPPEKPETIDAIPLDIGPINIDDMPNVPGGGRPDREGDLSDHIHPIRAMERARR